MTEEDHNLLIRIDERVASLQKEVADLKALPTDFAVLRTKFGVMVAGVSFFFTIMGNLLIYFVQGMTGGKT